MIANQKLNTERKHALGYPLFTSKRNATLLFLAYIHNEHP